MPKLVRARDSLVDRAAAALVDMIRTNGLETDAALPSTAELIDEFGVSRTVVREALADLAGRGIVRRAGREYVVGSPGAGELADLLAFRVHQQGHDVLEMHELREAIEVRAVEMAAQRRTSDDLVALREHLETMRAFRSELAFHDGDVAFHRQIAAASRNGLVALVLDALEPVLRESRRQSTAGWRARDIHAETVVDAHQAIFDAVDAGDPERAAAAMRYHLEQTRLDIEAIRGTSEPYWLGA